MWREGTIGIPKKDGGYKAVYYSVKVYEEGNQFGINGGKISKLTLKMEGVIIANYDRGWDIEPICEEANLALCILLNEHN